MSTDPSEASVSVVHSTSEGVSGEEKVAEVVENSRHELEVVNSDHNSAENFARRVIDRGFRMGEVGALSGLDGVEVVAKLMEPEVQVHLNRLVVTGEAAVSTVGARELQEAVSKGVRLTWKEYVKQTRVERGESKVSAAEYWGIKLRAAELTYKILVGPQVRGRKKVKHERMVNKALAADGVIAEVVK